MKPYPRQLNLLTLLKQKSFFLLGPRAIGKSFLIHEQLSSRAILINLLRSDLYLKLSSAPWVLESLIEAQIGKRKNPIVVIDEVQKLPNLLDEVHRLIEEKKSAIPAILKEAVKSMVLER